MSAAACSSVKPSFCSFCTNRSVSKCCPLFRLGAEVWNGCSVHLEGVGRLAHRGADDCRACRGHSADDGPASIIRRGRTPNRGRVAMSRVGRWIRVALKRIAWGGMPVAARRLVPEANWTSGPMSPGRPRLLARVSRSRGIGSSSGRADVLCNQAPPTPDTTVRHSACQHRQSTSIT